MKKFLLSIAAVAMALCSYATDFKGQLTVSITDNESGETDEFSQEATIALSKNEDGTYNFSLNNFMLGEGDDALAVGNIALENQEVTEACGYNTIRYNDDVEIAAGDMEGVQASDWLGPMLGPVPINLLAKFNDNVLSVSITIKLEVLPQGIDVFFIGTNPEAMGTPDDGRSPSDVNKDGAINVGDVNVVLDDILNERPAFPTAE